jgi:hypothetical protein
LAGANEFSGFVLNRGAAPVEEMRHRRDVDDARGFVLYEERLEEKKREKLTILAQPIDTLYNASADILRRAIPSVSNVGVDMSKSENRTPENYKMLFEYGKRHIDEYNKLVEFINGIYKDISNEFNVKVPQIDSYCGEQMINFSKIARDERKEEREEERKKKKVIVRSVADHDSDSDY